MSKLIQAIRASEKVGVNSCSVVDECYSDAELTVALAAEGITTQRKALVWANATHRRFEEAQREREAEAGMWAKEAADAEAADAAEADADAEYERLHFDCNHSRDYCPVAEAESYAYEVEAEEDDDEAAALEAFEVERAAEAADLAAWEELLNEFVLHPRTSARPTVADCHVMDAWETEVHGEEELEGHYEAAYGARYMFNPEG